ncbi:hypothetical protein ACN47E_007730 [Coniothyrium glycines]
MTSIQPQEHNMTHDLHGPNDNPPHLKVVPQERKRLHVSKDDDTQGEHAPAHDFAHPIATVLASKDDVESNIQYGVYMHDPLRDTQKQGSQPIFTRPDWSTAYDSMRGHARELINIHPDWSAPTELVKNDMFEVIDGAKKVRLRYDIALVQADASTLDGAPQQWQRRGMSSAAPSSSAPAPYGLHVHLYHPDREETEQHFIGGFTSFGTASHAMKASALAYLARHADVRLMERSIELVGASGRIAQRYTITDTPADFLKRPILPLPLPLPPTESLLVDEPAKKDAVQTISQPVSSSSPQDQDPLRTTDAELWCTCRGPDDGTLMLFCEDPACPVQWYHGRCLGIQSPPKADKWYCGTCKPAPTGTVAGRATRSRAVSVPKAGGGGGENQNDGSGEADGRTAAPAAKRRTVATKAPKKPAARIALKRIAKK